MKSDGSGTYLHTQTQNKEFLHFLPEIKKPSSTSMVAVLSKYENIILGTKSFSTPDE